MVRLDSPSARFAPFAFQLKRPIGAAAQGDWSNYVRAAALGLLKHGVPLERGIEGTVIRRCSHRVGALVLVGAGGGLGAGAAEGERNGVGG